jgi:tetraacyldisaccharide 4'-kinase
MNVLSPDWNRIHNQKTLNCWTLPLAVFSFFYGVGVRARLWRYYAGLLKAKRLPGFVVSLGNMTAGGTGKTPAVVMLAEWAVQEGWKVAILTRGYGGRHDHGVLEVSDGKRVVADSLLSGDEPFLLAKRLDGVPVIVANERYKAGMYAHRKFGSDFFILDDGYQHIRLARDMNFALIDSLNPFGNGHLLPWGPLREPLRQIKRADACIFTRIGKSVDVVQIPTVVRKEFATIPCFRADHLPESVVIPDSGESHSPEFLKGKRVVAFAGIGSPESFKETLLGIGAEVVRFFPFRDHYPFSGNDMDKILRMRESLNAATIITTEKDWMRISSMDFPRSHMAYLTIRFSVLGDRSEFFEMIRKSIERSTVG